MRDTQPYVPQDRSKQPTSDITSSAAAGQGGSSKARILCIEDEHFISELYTRALTRAGYEVKVVLDGADGLKEAMSDTYDIILLDLMIPTMTGMDVLKRLRAEAPGLHSKIIITTNLEQKDEVRAEIERQADGYVIKAEITPKQLVEFLSKTK